MPIKRDKDGVIIEITLTDDEEEKLDEEAAMGIASGDPPGVCIVLIPSLARNALVDFEV